MSPLQKVLLKKSVISLALRFVKQFAALVAYLPDTSIVPKVKSKVMTEEKSEAPAAAAEGGEEKLSKNQLKKLAKGKGVSHLPIAVIWVQGTQRI